MKRSLTFHDSNILSMKWIYTMFLNLHPLSLSLSLKAQDTQDTNTSTRPHEMPNNIRVSHIHDFLWISELGHFLPRVWFIIPIMQRAKNAFHSTRVKKDLINKH